ncbi:cysteine dioxygenase family protein [Kordia sp. YSTF-M3]|uniref:Cysteine dioxygenase family protein n=1 Tax=Kordia aestuariivivens TaxID=2759037 RepID=A0ABR7Q7U6_9FLAO|nr:cysteine dioxygenase family protein [Kordia aestuariivivens]MBC8754647.1 cysteine dioxygenase family protein [Kordia aestuariivivens]
MLQEAVLSQTLETLKTLIQTAVENEETITAARIEEFVKRAKVTPEDLKPYADFDHPVEDGYGRKMIYDGGKFEIMAMSWNPGDYSSIHNHGYTQWGVVQAFGNVHHFIYQNRNNQLRFAKKEILTEGAIVKVVNAMIHQMGNPSTDRYMTLHIYGCCDKSGEITADAKNYELEHDRVNHTTGGAFFNLPAEQIYDFEPGPIPTDDVFINYTKLMIDYYQRQEQTPEIIELKSNLIQKLQERICLS